MTQGTSIIVGRAKERAKKNRNGKAMKNYNIIHGNCLECIASHQIAERINLTFLDPPFNQDKEYTSCHDNLPEQEYWKMMKSVCRRVYEITAEGGVIYFMQREKNGDYSNGFQPLANFSTFASELQI